MNELSLLLTTREAARLLDVSLATFWRLVKNGQIELVRVGSRGRRARRADIERIVDKGTV